MADESNPKTIPSSPVVQREVVSRSDSRVTETVVTLSVTASRRLEIAGPLPPAPPPHTRDDD